SKMEFDGHRAHSKTENTLFNGRLTYAFDDESELGIIFNSTDQPVAQDPGGIDLAQAQADPTSARQQNVDFDASEVLEQQRLGLTYIKSSGEHHELRLRNHFVWRDFANKLPFVGGGATQFERFYVGGGATYAYNSELWGRPNSLIVGVDLDRQDDDRQRFDNVSGVVGPMIADQTELVSNVGLFVQNEMTLSDDFVLTLGLRYDEIEYQVKDKFLSDGDDSAKRTLDEVSPMIAVLYSPFETAAFYATISTAFESPTTVELSNPSGTGGFNPNIDPQFATNYEVGIRGTIAERNRYEAAVYYIDVEDELIPFEIGGRDIFVNAGKSTREGVELSFTSEPVDGLIANVAYTYSEFKFDTFVTGGGDDFSGNKIPGIPENVLYGEVAYTHPSGFYGVIDARNVGKLYANNSNSVDVDSYTVVNLRAGLADWRLGNWVLGPFVGVNNLTDEDYFAEIRINSFGGRYYEPAPERHFYGGLSIRYNFAR
ncbi:MAG: TonB-dependent receptor, partial [Gammaproteobacteria bacterium]|nr:TonB-dependent receptor [Gammaproteobacteria bacterium]